METDEIKQLRADIRHQKLTRKWIIYPLFFVALVLSTATLYIAEKTKDNTDRANIAAHRATQANCVIVSFLDGSIKRNALAIKQAPHSPMNEQRQDAINQSIDLRDKMLASGIRCDRMR